MVLRTEIKDFVKKVLLLGVGISVIINLLVTNFSSIGGDTSLYAESNDLRFKRVDTRYLGTTGVALSLNVGTSHKEALETPVNLSGEVPAISSAISDAWVGRNKLISANMVALSEYLNVVKTNVNSLLDQSPDRETTLESFLEQLRQRYNNSLEAIRVLNAQGKELQASDQATSLQMTNIKTQLTLAYKNLDYDKTESLLDDFLEARRKNTYAKTYTVFVTKFVSSYEKLNAYNKILMDTILNNKEALIKDVTVVLPDSGNELLKKLDLVKTEADWKKLSN